MQLSLWETIYNLSKTANVSRIKHKNIHIHHIIEYLVSSLSFFCPLSLRSEIDDFWMNLHNKKSSLSGSPSGLFSQGCEGNPDFSRKKCLCLTECSYCQAAVIQNYVSEGFPPARPLCGPQGRDAGGTRWAFVRAELILKVEGFTSAYAYGHIT